MPLHIYKLALRHLFSSLASYCSNKVAESCGKLQKITGNFVSVFSTLNICAFTKPIKIQDLCMFVSVCSTDRHANYIISRSYENRSITTKQCVFIRLQKSDYCIRKKISCSMNENKTKMPVKISLP